MQAAPRQNTAKLPSPRPVAQTSPPTTPSSAPPIRPWRRPRRCMNIDSGDTAARLPSTSSASGRVASAGQGASRRPATEVSVMPMIEHDQ